MPESVISEVRQLIEPIRKDVVNPTEKVTQTIYERLGGQEAINLAVDKFYEKVLKDNRVKSFFTKIDMKKQAQL